DRFHITIHGQGGHGGYPHETKDALVVAAELVAQLQTIVSRTIDPLKTAVVTIGEFHAGNGFNVVANEAKLSGTVRYFDSDIQEQIIEQIENMTKGISIAHGVTYSIDYIRGYPPLINHKEVAELVINASKHVREVKKTAYVAPSMAGEDFAYYLLHKPGAFFFTGASTGTNTYPHHHPKFDFDERAMPVAAKTLISAYFEYQKKSLA